MNKEKLVELKSAMEAEQKINQEIAEEREQFEKEHTALFEIQTKIREQIMNCKVILTENAEVGFAQDGIKKRLGGVGIRVAKTLDYDSNQALNWAKEKDLFLQLDTKAFEKVAKTETIDFVKIGEKVTVTFPKEIKLEDE